MSTYFSPEMWFLFITRIFNSIYPVELILIIFFIIFLFASLGKNEFCGKIRNLIKLSSHDDIPSLNFRVKGIIQNRVSLFLMIFIVCELGVRSVIFFAGVPFSGRYFIPFSISITIFAAAGIFPFSEFLTKAVGFVKIKIQPWKFFYAIILITCFAYTGKALLPHFDKPFLKEFGAAIKKRSHNRGISVILTNKLDERVGYYGGTEHFFKFYIHKGKWYLQKKVRNKNASKWIIAGKRDSLSSFIQLIDSEIELNFPGEKNINLFVIIRSSRNKTVNKELESLEKCKKMLFIQELPASKKRSMKLYELHNSK
jgi:hypothetical protein